MPFIIFSTTKECMCVCVCVCRSCLVSIGLVNFKSKTDVPMNLLYYMAVSAIGNLNNFISLTHYSVSLQKA